jgi:hypothetical protein
MCTTLNNLYCEVMKNPITFCYWKSGVVAELHSYCIDLYSNRSITLLGLSFLFFEDFVAYVHRFYLKFFGYNLKDL